MKENLLTQSEMEMLDSIVLCLVNDGEFYKQTNGFQRELVWEHLWNNIVLFTYQLDKIETGNIISKTLFGEMISPILSVLDMPETIPYLVNGISNSVPSDDRR